MSNHRGAAVRLLAALSPLLIGLATLGSSAPVDADYTQKNLVSNIPGVAQFTDPQLRNAWGMSSSPTGSPIWVSDNFPGLSTLYTGAGVKQGLVVTIAPPLGSPAGTTASPTGQVFNSTANFNNERFIFATEDGTISGFTGATTTVLNVDNSTSAVYKGIAINTANTLLYAANFGTGKIDVFNSTPGSANFGSANLGGGAFTDPNLPSGYAPFNIQDLGGSLYVTYAVVNPMSPGDDLPGLGNGIVDVYDESGANLRRLITGGVLDSPWGLAIAPADFGVFSHDLLVGNFGNGLIHAYNPATGAFVGTMADFRGNPIDIDGLWGLKFGSGQGNGGAANVLYFAAGPNGESDGLFGTLAVPEPASATLVGIALAALAGMRRRAQARATA